MSKIYNASDLEQEFEAHDRGDNFSNYDHLFECLSEIYCNEDENYIEIDVIGVCCDLTEYSNYEFLRDCYDNEDLWEAAKEIADYEMMNAEVFTKGCYKDLADCCTSIILDNWSTLQILEHVNKEAFSWREDSIILGD